MCGFLYYLVPKKLNWGKPQQNITALAVFLEFWKCTSMHNHLPVRYLCDLYNSTLKNILLWKHSPSCKLPPITPMRSLHSQELLSSQQPCGVDCLYGVWVLTLQIWTLRVGARSVELFLEMLDHSSQSKQQNKQTKKHILTFDLTYMFLLGQVCQCHISQGYYKQTEFSAEVLFWMMYFTTLLIFNITWFS